MQPVILVCGDNEAPGSVPGQCSYCQRKVFVGVAGQGVVFEHLYNTRIMCLHCFAFIELTRKGDPN